MDADLIQKLQDEEAELSRKLEAVRSLLSAYGILRVVPLPNGLISAPTASAPPRGRADMHSRGVANSGREKVPLERFGDYGRTVVQAAIDECRSHLGSPIASRDMVTLVEQKGIEVRGNDKVNAISALLARSIDLKPNGRKGWTLSDEFLERERRAIAELFGEENEPRSGDAGGSDAVSESAPTLELTEAHSIEGAAA